MSLTNKQPGRSADLSATAPGTDQGAVDGPAPGDAGDLKRRFAVALVERSPAPDGTEDPSWYRYVIKNGLTTITGSRSGSREEVTSHASEFAQNLNSRNSPRSRAPYMPRRKTPRPTG